MTSHQDTISTNSFVAAGTTFPIYAIGENHVLKAQPSSGDFEQDTYAIEVRCYKRLGHHERIARCEVTESGLVLERGTCLRKILQDVGFEDSPISLTLNTKLRWAREAAEGLAYVHSKGIIHADVGCHNIIADGSEYIKFIDFAGSGVDGEAPLVCYEWCSPRPGNDIGVSTDIFAFGSMLFEIETGRVPYSELEKTLETGELVGVMEELFRSRKFPPVDDLVLGSIVSGCWNGEYLSMGAVHQDVKFVSSEGA